MAKTPNPDIYRPIDVPESIRPYVRRALVADTIEPVDMFVDVTATGYHYFGWNWRGRWRGLVDGETWYDSDVDGSISLSGQVTTSEIAARMERDIGQIFLEFSALGHFQLLGITGAEMLEAALAPQVLKPALKPHLEMLLTVKEASIGDRMEMIASCFSLLPKHRVSEGIVTAIELIEAADGDIRISDIVRELGLAERQFRTEFKTLVGLTPKGFCDTLRINRALNQLLTSNGGDLAGVAAQAGFSDQAHFTRAFSAYLGKAPKKYLGDIEATLARFAGQSRPD